jgi:hypothetical protein
MNENLVHIFEAKTYINIRVSTGETKQENRMEVLANTLLLRIHSLCCKNLTSLQESLMSGGNEDPRWDEGWARLLLGTNNNYCESEADIPVRLLQRRAEWVQIHIQFA